MAFKRGSIIRRPLTGWYADYTWIVGISWHMGVYVGKGRVIHFDGEKDSTDARVCKVSLEEFANEEEVELHAAPKSRQHATAVCAEAERILRKAKNGYNDEYHFVVNNCEDFCVACYEVSY